MGDPWEPMGTHGVPMGTHGKTWFFLHKKKIFFLHKKKINNGHQKSQKWSKNTFSQNCPGTFGVSFAIITGT